MRLMFEVERTITSTQHQLEEESSKIPFQEYRKGMEREQTFQTDRDTSHISQKPTPVYKDNYKKDSNVRFSDDTPQAIAGKILKKGIDTEISVSFLSSTINLQDPSKKIIGTTELKDVKHQEAKRHSEVDSDGPVSALKEHTKMRQADDLGPKESATFQDQVSTLLVHPDITLHKNANPSPVTQSSTKEEGTPMANSDTKNHHIESPVTLKQQPKTDKDQLSSAPLVPLVSKRDLLQSNNLPELHPTVLKQLDEASTSCQKKTHIVFLKTHKTASSTILNILYRFGDARNLTFALPHGKYNQLFYPFYFAAFFVEGFRSKTIKEYDIMCNHMRFHISEVRKVMPEDSFYFSILRNPVTMMESSFSYYKYISAFSKVSTLDQFLQDPWSHYNTSLPNNHYAKNLLTFDFGFNNNGKDERHLNLSIAMIAKTFNLILISEYFDESMILLKNALCWSLDDVVSFKLNSRNNKTKQQLSMETMEKIKEWNSLDWKLYLHFNRTFWRKIDESMGREKMQDEVEQLRDRRNQLMKICLQEGGAVDPSQVKDTSFKPFQYGAAEIQGYNLNPHLNDRTKTHCQRLITPELQYTALLYDKQFPDMILKASVQNKTKQTHSQTWKASKAKMKRRRNLNHQGAENQNLRRSVYRKRGSKRTAQNNLPNMP
ncbi:galactose-3-O-sulfotransferase 2-like [Polyodon spathula]|uniref:galactose-3-O-sulfotransferase 2-like n=1 Tax=Polyodon spathula TaxID=7913 RepID=UPI001B7E6871|nr:galactose-3-O-sulfotransferase 2-like [Polyodon spathula]